MFGNKYLTASLLAIGLTAQLGCVQYATERQSVVDLRPQISFQFDLADARMNEARILVDGLDVGRMSDFADGKAALVVVPGTHAVRVVSGSDVLLDERAYIGDGVARPFIVK